MPQVKSFLGGLLLGAMMGAMAMFLFAPRSGKRTRSKMQHQYDELRDQVAETIEEAEEDLLSQAHRAFDGIRGSVKELQHQRPELLKRK